MILGTAAYMSPEQARGQAVDKRADVWAFGVILFEMLTGTRLFQGDTTSDVLAAVLRSEVDWNRLPAETPPARATAAAALPGARSRRAPPRLGATRGSRSRRRCASSSSRRPRRTCDRSSRWRALLAVGGGSRRDSAAGGPGHAGDQRARRGSRASRCASSRRPVAMAGFDIAPDGAQLATWRRGRSTLAPWTAKTPRAAEARGSGLLLAGRRLDRLHRERRAAVEDKSVGRARR